VQALQPLSMLAMGGIARAAAKLRRADASPADAAEL
jgi:hypothetical protein